MGLEDAALNVLRQTKTYDAKLQRWIKNITVDKDFQHDFKEWQVNVSQSKLHQRTDAALYLLACHVVWFRMEDRMSEKRLGEVLAEFHLKTIDAQKKAVVLERFKRFGYFEKKW